MSVSVLIAHARGEESAAESLATPIRAAGYEVVHGGTVLVGDSVVAQYASLMAAGCPVVLCGTVRAMGTRWARLVANAARMHAGVRLLVVQMEEEADTDTVSFDEVVSKYWIDPKKAEAEIISSLNRWYPPSTELAQALVNLDLEEKYRILALRACDIIDLANLPEDDRHLASRELELRRLYVALRMRLEATVDEKFNDKALQALERRRTASWAGKAGNREDEERVPLGTRLKSVRRLVVLGDPGSGKSTLLRWIATAYLLRLQQAPDWQDLPDIATLPDEDWLPILIRCRDLPPTVVTLDDMLHHTLRRSELPEEQCLALRRLLRTRIENGKGLLLIDGLDELTDPRARARFAEHLESIHRAHVHAPIVVTSRIVGYREMGYRIRSGFEHLTVADLAREDKDEFARRWCMLTERPERRGEAAEDLIRDIHSSDRIERLTGNPMLLTTMALIKRKIGRLPQRRVDLYQKAVEVLLNWRSAVDAAVDQREALPQLEFLAHAMCADGVQQLREDQLLEVLRSVRREYPQIHALQQHTPEEFLSLLERRTGLIVQSGHTRHKGRSLPVYEFRHLTFQEYLAGIALVQGHFRDRKKEHSLAEVIAPLAGQLGEGVFGEDGDPEPAVVENWREALRLCLAACADDDVDAALIAVGRPQVGEVGTARPRAVLAALCLADEPNVGDEVAHEVLRTLTSVLHEADGDGHSHTSVDMVVDALRASRWRAELGEHLLDAYERMGSEDANVPGGVLAVLVAPTPDELTEWADRTVERLPICGEREAIQIALGWMHVAYSNGADFPPGLADALIKKLFDIPTVSHAAAWALGWMVGDGGRWVPTAPQMKHMIAAASMSGCDPEAMFWLSRIFRVNRVREAVGVLAEQLNTSPERTKQSIVGALSEIGTAFGEEYIEHESAILRRAAMQGLLKRCPDEIDRKLLSETLLLDGEGVDPKEPITAERVRLASRRIGLPKQEIAQRYRALATQFRLTLDF